MDLFRLAFVLFLFSTQVRAAQVRIKDLADVQGMRENSLFGYGLVMGLSGTGDTYQSNFTPQSIAGMLGRLGIRVDPKSMYTRDVAAVIVTAQLPTFARPGGKIDVTVSAMGDARSLAGGVLLMTPLAGADGNIYALAQGPLQTGGFQVASAGSLLRKNITTSGTIPEGATIEKTVAPPLGSGPLVLALRTPDFTNSTRVAAAIEKSLGAGSARALDAAAVEVTAPAAFKTNPVGLIAKLEELEIDADRRAKVVVSERTGTVVVGEKVRLHAAAVSYGALQVSIAQRPLIVQPAPFSQGQTAIKPVADLQANEKSRPVVSLPSTASVDELVKALNLLGAGPRDLIAILQGLKAAGALEAELEIM